MAGAHGLRAAWLALAVLGCCGCDTVPERDVRDVGTKLPTHWTGPAESAGRPVESWLDSFGDRRLSALVRTALADNHDLKAAAARVKSAQAQARLDGAARWPQLAFVPGYQRAQVRSSGFGSTEFGAFQALFDSTWELDVWGRLRDFHEAAGREADAVAADLAGARLSLAARTAQSYFELAEANLQIEVVERSVQDRRTLVELVRGRFTRGLTRGLDLRLALTDLAKAEALLAKSRDQVQRVARRLETLLGRYPAGKVAHLSTLPDPPAALPTGLPSELLTRRPDVVAAFERLRSADLRVASAEKARLPRIALTATGGTRTPALAELADPRSAVWSLFLGMAQPLFTGGRITGEADRTQALAEEALHRYRNAALNAFREVEQALAAEQWLREQEQALREAVAQTEASRELAVYAYRHGTIEILTLLDNYRSTLDAQSAHLAVRRQLLNNRIDIYLALGGGA